MGVIHIGNQLFRPWIRRSGRGWQVISNHLFAVMQSLRMNGREIAYPDPCDFTTASASSCSHDGMTPHIHSRRHARHTPIRLKPVRRLIRIGHNNDLSRARFAH